MKTIEEMKAEITKVLEAVLNDGRLALHEIERARFSHADTLKHSVSDEQIQDMYGFITYCRNNSERFKDSFPGGLDTYISFNIAHDIYEFFKNSTEDWFSPRTSGYRKHLNP